jgi:hypothetical protein
MKLTELSAAPEQDRRARLSLRCRLMPAPARSDAGTASQLIPGVRQTRRRSGVMACSIVPVLLAVAVSADSPTRVDAIDPIADTLQVMQEPPIGHLPAQRAFRFLWMRSFHEPIVVTVEKGASGQVLTVKMLDRPWSLGVDGVHIGKLTYDRRRALTDSEWQRLADLRPEGFWKQAAAEPETEGVDGAYWILDGVSWGERHSVKRWSPTAGPFRELCLAMLNLSGLTIAPDKVY